MEAISNLGRLWSPFTSCSSILSPAIPTDNLDFWMRLHPGFCCFSFAIRQEVNDLVALQVQQDRAEFSPTTEGKVIYSKLRYPFSGCCWKDHETTKDRCGRRLNSQTSRQSSSQLSTGCQAN